MSRKPSCVKASREAVFFILLNNLYKFNLDSKTLLIYTLVAYELGVAVVVLGILDDKKYEERFGYG